MGDGNEQDKHYKLLAIVLMALAMVVSFSYGQAVADSGHRLAAAMAALIVSSAPFALGGFLGFLFGIPKTLQAPEPTPTSTNGATPTAPRRHGWQANTNLEQVSDWLTKILIGVGLTQLQSVPAEVQSTGEYFASAFGKNASSSIVTAMLVSFSIGGFTIAYLLTKFDLGRAIDREDGTLNALANAIIKNPNDREAVESFMLSSLYLDAPDGFEKAIQAGKNFLSQEGHPKPEDTNVFAYLACGYGQQYAWQQSTKASGEALAQTRSAVLENVKRAIADDKAWLVKFRQLMSPPVGSKDDDLAALKDDAELKAALEVA